MGLKWGELPPLAGGPVHTRTPDDTVVYAIGDIHGRCDLLALIHEGITEDCRQRPARRRLLVYLGDYVSRGIDSHRVVEQALKERPGKCEMVGLKGNHEDLLLRYLSGDLNAGWHWFEYGGLDTLAHYGVPASLGLNRDDRKLETLRACFAKALPGGHLAFFRSLVVNHSEGGYLFVHAGVRPGVPLSEQSDYDQMWIRKRFLDSDQNHGAMVVHGHSTAPRVQIRRNRIGIDTGAYASGVLTCLVLDGEQRSYLQTEPEG